MGKGWEQIENVVGTHWEQQKDQKNSLQHPTTLELVE
jgi:hypothetical protein